MHVRVHVSVYGFVGKIVTNPFLIKTNLCCYAGVYEHHKAAPTTRIVMPILLLRRVAAVPYKAFNCQDHKDKLLL